MVASETVAPLVKYSVTDAEIALLRERFDGLSVTGPNGYEAIRLAVGELRDLRVAVEKRRVELKADALAFGRNVDAEAKRITVQLSAIEDPLKAQKDAVDNEKARIRQEEEAARIRALEAVIQANRERQEAALKAVRDAEEARLAAERIALDAERAILAEERRKADEAAAVARKAEDERLRVERARLEQIEAAQRLEQDAIDADLRKVAAEREQAERAEFERQAKIKAAAEAAKQAERDRLAAAEQRAKLDALKPDIEKVHAFATAIRALWLAAPKPRSKDAKAVIADAVEVLEQVASDLDAFGVA